MRHVLLNLCVSVFLSGAWSQKEYAVHKALMSDHTHAIYLRVGLFQSAHRCGL